MSISYAPIHLYAMHPLTTTLPDAPAPANSPCALRPPRASIRCTVPLRTLAHGAGPRHDTQGCGVGEAASIHHHHGEATSGPKPAVAIPESGRSTRFLSDVRDDKFCGMVVGMGCHGHGYEGYVGSPKSFHIRSVVNMAYPCGPRVFQGSVRRPFGGCKS